MHSKKSYSAQLSIFCTTLAFVVQRVQHYEKEPIELLKNQYEPSIKVSASFLSSPLESRIPSLINSLMFIPALVKQVSGTEGDGNRVPSGDFSRELAEAGRMMREMRTRNFGKNLREAEAERREAQQCKDPSKCVHPVCSDWLDIQGAEYTVPGWGRDHHFNL